MNNGSRYLFRRLAIFNKLYFSSVPQASALPTLEADQKLVKRGDFRGVAATNLKNRSNTNPDVVLSKIQQNLGKNYRIPGDIILIDVVRQIEAGNEKFIELLKRSTDRWVPILISSCGHPLSNVDKIIRTEILDRLWNSLSENVETLPVEAWNARFAALNQNEADWNVTEELDKMERSGIQPNAETFHELVTRLANLGDVDGCRNMVYNMARKGFPVDSNINASSVFVFSVRGHYQKADSLCEQAAVKYGEQGAELAFGAACRAAACRGDMDRLRQVLRKSVKEGTTKLILSCNDILETIWLMAEKSRDGTGQECALLVEQMLNCTSRDAGFFRKLYREVERHICHRHYYTALSLLEDTKRVSECLENQQRSLFLVQLIGKLATQLIRSQESTHLIRDVANRVHFTFNRRGSKLRIRMYDDLVYSACLLKDMKLDERLEYFRTFVDEIDISRERIHMTLPLLTSEENLEIRLSALYRLSVMGYRNWSNIDINPMVSIILQPLYNSGRPFRDQSKLDKLSRVLKSYGINDKNIWHILYNWSKKKQNEEKHSEEDQWKRPFSRDLRGWCRAYYSETFENPKTTTKKAVSIPYDKFKVCVDQGDIGKLTAILNNSGWPIDTNYEEIAPKVIDLYLNHETWKNTENMLADLSAHSAEWQEESHKTPVKNYHLLCVLRRLAEEGETLSIRNITDYAYELRNLYPHATCHYDGFFETQNEYKRLFSKCFERLEKQKMTTEAVDELIDFLRCLVKLELIQLHPTENLTVFFINIVLKRIGWNEALNTWQKFLSSLHCPNGTVALLRHCLMQNSDESRKNLQFVIHRGSTFLSHSRIHAMYLSVLIGMRKFEEAEKVCDLNEGKIEANDCLMAMRLMNSLKARSFDEQFMLDFSAICLRRLNLSKNPEVAQNMQADLLRICDSRHMGPAALRVYDLFSNYDVKLRDEEKNRLATVIEKHSALSKKWIFKPDGFLNIQADDEIITQSEEAKIEEKLKKELKAGL
ncbi:unnamed protein product [Caenorhabditis angaria]|uniref:Pentacotripeptide-repeat region of PRORP domain-containing protein n=1 Tax=Caenorhabditis angaria TaxID=860376 RepID=A0A9P1IXF1_9PELO|nr:unnamed protein product [Caenorhabditis angaria]